MICHKFLIRTDISAAQQDQARTHMRKATDSVDKCQGYCSLRPWAQDGLLYPGENDRVRPMSRSDHENHGRVPGTDIFAGSRCDDKADDRNAKGPDDVEGAIVEPVRRPGVQGRDKNPSYIGRYGEEQSVGAMESECLDH